MAETDPGVNRMRPSDDNQPRRDTAGGGPLSGIRVVEVTRYVQGPIGGLLLAGLGAEVTKIELVGRVDAMRTATALHGVRLDERGQEWLYAAVNRHKRALTLDVTCEEGRDVFHRLVAGADVFLTNLRDDGLAALGADAETLHGVNPRLVFAQGGGLGPAGPLAKDPCQDTIGMAYGGFMDLASTDGDPNYPPGSLSDVLTGTNIAAGVMAALVERQRTGLGGVVRTSQLQSLLWLQQLAVGMLASLGARMPRFVRAEATPLYSAFETSDGWIAVAAIHAHHWPPLARALGLGHLLDDPRFAEFDELESHKSELAEHFAAAFRQRSTAEWHERLREAGVWCSPVNRLEDLPQDPQVLANGYLVDHPDGFVTPSTPFEVNGWSGSEGVAADYGQHTDEILSELGYDEERRVELRAAGAVW